MNPRPAALVTGGAGGIGREAARRLAGHGLHVVVADIDRHGAQTTAAEVGGTAMPLDVGDPYAWRSVVDHITGNGLALNAALFNAGVALGEAEVLDLDLASYRRAWSVNVDGVVFGLRALVPLLEAERGHAVVTASLAGLTAVPFDPVYAMTKHAIIGLVRGYGPTLGNRGVGLHAVCPGLVDTAMLGAAREELDRLEFPLVRVPDVAAALVDCALGTDPSEVVVVQPGRAPLPYQFPGVPGGRTGKAMPALPDLLPIGTRRD
ncbi:dehydrogenase [Pseudonocardia sulfidoxydans NBRC 16205]|uniref:Dehydrogenase n=2 Tax=Pseudonocardia sulfidoxydans TaxID=54011 RepID=A0A511DK80_9PSEU|nr:SDR family oxidoreductase [Pseudonocardia sulfidoxydans]GEL25229.1 dehydrogenase [Pseudonocardia sulfidoxydans NBRC 16205]